MAEDQFSLQDQLLKNYDGVLDVDGVNGKRLANRLDQISHIGLTKQNGSNRPGFSKEEKQAKDLVASWMEGAGLHVTHDGAGNVFGRLAGKNDQLPAVVSGSHIDSVPDGGHFDGVLGVLLALEVVEAWKSTGYQPEKPFEVAIFTDEEGARFNGGFHGSEAITGNFNLDENVKLTDSMGLSFEEVLHDIGSSVDEYVKAQRKQEDIELFVETHIEQGKRLEKKDLPCGVVTGIAGPCWLEFTFYGQAGHAGNTPMNDRKDALIAVSEFNLEINKLPSQISDSAVVTIGKIHVEPNGVNVIPGKVTLYVDIRDIYQDTRDDIVNKVINMSEQIAEKHSIEVKYEEKMRVKPVPIEEKYQNFLKESCSENGIEPYSLPSGAGHDAMILGERWPIAMLFVKSKDGISHNPKEWTDLIDCVKAAHVLKRFVERVQSE